MQLFIMSPLEQFQIFSVCSFLVASFDFSVTNSTIIIMVGLCLYCFFFQSLKKTIAGGYSVVPNNAQVLAESFFEVVISLIKDSVGKKGQEFFPFIFGLFSFIVTANLIGLVPYSFTITSHLSVSFSLAVITFFGMNFICLSEHNYRILGLFLPAGSSLLLAFILVPIEFVSARVRHVVRFFIQNTSSSTFL